MGEQTSDVAALALPAGTVTFLLTDIERSTRLWETAADAMPAAVGRHYEILDDAIARHRGVRPVEQGEGDSTVAAFARAADAVAAAVDAQRALLRESWPHRAQLRVRIGVHTGDARLRDQNNYFGASINRCARLRAVARGGEILASRATYDLLQDTLPPGIELVDLGVHRLRDLARPEHVFGVTHADLPPITEPLRSLDPSPNNLPAETSSFVGRERELSEVTVALGSARALTLTGAGGCGKTRLALRAAVDALRHFPDGAWWVELASLGDPHLLGDSVAAAVGVRPLPGQSGIDAVVGRLADRRALIVLDNCEHLLEHAATLAEALLRGCPHLRILATSREPLGLPAEVNWLVPSLSLPPLSPPPDAHPPKQSDAMRLFAERAAQARATFTVTAESEAAVARICRELDGIPLAIELAAARIRLLTVEQIAAGLGDRFRLLTGGARTALPRQQTLLASVEWSHDLLGESERILLRRLAVFAGGFTLAMCEEVCADAALDRPAILDLLASLVDKCLVLVEESGPLTRYRLLETVRHYALDRLLEAGEAQRARDRHRDAFVAFAERVEPELLTEREPEALDLLDADAANLHAAIEWAAQTKPDLALRLCTALALWWRLRGLFRTGDTAIERALAAAPVETSALRARSLWARAYLAVWTGEFGLLAECANAALEMGEELADEWIQGRALHALAFPTLWGDPSAAVGMASRGRELARSAGDEFIVADMSQLLGSAHWMRDDYEAARREQALAFEGGRRLGNRDIIAFYWFSEGMTPWGSADFERRREMIECGLATTAEVGDLATAGFGEAYLAFVDIQSGDPAAALERLVRAREQQVSAGAVMTLGSIDYYTGLAQAALGRVDEAHATLTDLVERNAEGFAYVCGWAVTALSALARIGGNVPAARADAERALGLADHIGSPLLAAGATHELARLAAARGDWSAAERLLHGALSAYVDRQHTIAVPHALEALAEVAGGLESQEEAARLLAAARRARADRGLATWLPEHEHWEALRGSLCEALGNEAYEAAVGQGDAMTMQEAVAYATRARGARKRPSGGWESLTPTEDEVARHAAAGLTNPEIGERMFISRGTVKVHLSHIYAKLGIRNRTELTAQATRREHA